MEKVMYLCRDLVCPVLPVYCHPHTPIVSMVIGTAICISVYILENYLYTCLCTLFAQYRGSCHTCTIITASKYGDSWSLYFSLQHFGQVLIFVCLGSYSEDIKHIGYLGGFVS